MSLVTFRQCDKGGKGLSGMLCRVEYLGAVVNGIVEVVDPMRHVVVVYLLEERRVVEVSMWEVEEVNQKQRR